MFPLQPGTMETYTETWTGSKYLISELLNIRYKIIKYRMPTKKINNGHCQLQNITRTSNNENKNTKPI
jgi:hypothetical protein